MMVEDIGRIDLVLKNQNIAISSAKLLMQNDGAVFAQFPLEGNDFEFSIPLPNGNVEITKIYKNETCASYEDPYSAAQIALNILNTVKNGSIQSRLLLLLACAIISFFIYKSYTFIYE